jgi:hypothetical protein
MTSRNDRQRPPPDHAKELLRLFNSLAYRHSAWQVFSDFNEAAAISISNAVDWAQRETREARYMELIKRYDKEELDKFPQMFAHLVEALEAEPSDVLGKTFHELELHNKWAGQFFTPYDLCKMMAKMTADKEHIEGIIAERGFVRASEPAAGSGAMVIALAGAFKDAGINYQQHLHVTAVDVDLKCVHMAYAQLSLLHIPAVIVHGNSLSLEEHSRWYTPAHIMGGWNYKLRRAFSGDEKHEIIPAPAPKETSPSGQQEEKPINREPPSQLTLF